MSTQIELQSGKIFIDGVDITTLPRSVLRNAMTIIPQGEKPDILAYQVTECHLSELTVSFVP